MDDKQQRPPQDWQTVVVYLDKESGCAVAVRRDMACPWPKFSLKVGRKLPDHEEVSIFIPLMVERQEGRLRYDPVAIFPALLAQANTYVLEQVAVHELAREAQRQERAAEQQPQRRPAKEGHRVMRRGKTSRDRANKLRRRNKERD